MNKAFLFLFFTVCFYTVHSQVWQWSTEVDGIVSTETGAAPRAFLWIPEPCKQVKAIVIGQHNMLEEAILEHPAFRRTLRELNFAEIWISPSLSMVYNMNEADSLGFANLLQKLAGVSGYTELAFAPVVPIGHSAIASFPWNFAAGNPGRTLAVLSIHGDAPLTPLTGSGKPNPEWGNRNLDGIPGLMVEGEYEWWMDRVNPALKYRQQHPKAPVSFLADAGRGHFDYSGQLVAYLGLFLRKAASNRLPAAMPLDRPPVLRPVIPSAGWLADRWRPDSLPLAQAAPYNIYRGDPAQAFWYFDAEMATATEQYYATARGKKDQYIGYLQADTLLRFQPKLHARITPVFQPLADGVSFHIAAAFTDSLRTKKVLHHASTPVVLSRICGPVVKINDTTFSIRFYRMGFNNPKRSGDIWLMAANTGDARYKSTVQQANLRIPVINKEGAAQTIHFPEIADQRFPLRTISLQASASSRMPVYYYVLEGPVLIKENRLVFTPIPPRTRYPIKVTLVAWQYGRSIEPKIQSAVPVFNTFYIQK